MAKKKLPTKSRRLVIGFRGGQMLSVCNPIEAELVELMESIAKDFDAPGAHRIERDGKLDVFVRREEIQFMHIAND